MSKDLWKEGKWIDFWSFNHLLSGVIVGPILYSFDITLGWSFAIVTVLFIGWEIVEYIFRVEHLSNQIADTVINYFGYGIFYLFYYVLEKPFHISVLILLILVFILLEILGFTAWKKRVARSEINP